MKFLFKTILITLIYSSLVLPQEGADFCSQGKIQNFSRLNKSSGIHYPGDKNIDVTFYKLDLTLKTFPNYLNGIVTINFKSTANNLENIVLDLKNNLIVSSVIMNGQNLSFTQGSDKLLIILDRAYLTNEELSVKITYGGQPSAGSGFISSSSISFFDDNAAKKVIATLSEPYGAKDWWPCKDTPADKADSSEVWITAEKFFVSVSNGKLMGTVDNADGTRTYKWKNHYPIANYLISIACTNYTLIEDSFEYEPGKFLPIYHYNYPEKVSGFRNAVLEKTKNMLQIYSNIFGPYPFLKEKYGHAEFAWGGGMEHQTISSMGAGAMNSESVVAHELAHQWFGDKITCRNWENIWLNEGFATYSDKLYHEAAYGKETFKTQMNAVLNNAKNARSTLYVQNIASESEIFNSSRSYYKGAAVLHMLRGIVGDEIFFKILQEYLVEPKLAYNVAITEDFQAVAERVSGQDLSYFFQQWIYGENYPKYTVGWSYRQTAGDNYIVNFRLKQQTNTNPLFFIMPVQIRITTSKSVVSKTLLNDVQDQGWEILVEGTPISMEFDPDLWLLRDIVGTTDLEPEEQPYEFSLYQNYPNPFNPETTISYVIPNRVRNLIDYSSTSSPRNDIFNVSLKVYDIMGREVATLVNETQQSGMYNVKFSENDLTDNSSPDTQHSTLSTGIYFYRLRADSFTITKKMILMK